jgi:hypothetical protein
MSPLLALSWRNLPLRPKGSYCICKRTFGDPASLPRAGGPQQSLGSVRFRAQERTRYAKAPAEAGAISRCKSGPEGRSRPPVKRVLREAAAMPNTKRTQRLRGVCD